MADKAWRLVNLERMASVRRAGLGVRGSVHSAMSGSSLVVETMMANSFVHEAMTGKVLPAAGSTYDSENGTEGIIR